ncbi:hypothetical protein HYC85_029463 [Camellia sinensis]|uniref:Uncharacterized protein n=1 Tax=Camellia sinensis TaxID=4442 RepID=A0A7J7FY34_CAMSI|nr:hypothetical protein HYC85_029463 [Camellia sinensis]
MFGLKGIRGRKEGKSMSEVPDATMVPVFLFFFSFFGIIICIHINLLRHALYFQKKVQEFHNSSTNEGPKSIKDDTFFQTFGPKDHGSARRLGFGALPSKVDAQVH